MMARHEPVKHTEHEWRFAFYAAGDIVWQCEMCGQLRTCWQDARIGVVEQRLTAVLMEKSSLLIENAQMRSLLYLFSADEAEPVVWRDTSDGEGWFCERCDTWTAHYEPDPFPHAPECPWLQARALLADKEPEP